MSKLKTVLAGLLAATALASGPSARAAMDPKALVMTPPDQIQWKGDPGKPQSVVLAGDPNKGGSLYVMLIKWPPHQSSRPHSHPHDRFITVLDGTWWVNTGAKYSPETMTAVAKGSFVTHFGNQIHYDGTKDDGAVIEIVGIGPATMTPREEK